jgi:hypothetical protein
MSRIDPQAGKVAIVVAHPGHELVVHHYLERNHPLYCCLTDGSGGKAQSRLESTSRLLQRTGAVTGPIYGRFSDKALYRLLLDGQVEVFVDLVNELAESLTAADIESVAGDAMEGFNPGHDLCRALIDSAVAIIQTRSGRTLRNYEFAVYNDPAADTKDVRLRLELDDDALARKIEAAMAYREVKDDVLDALARFGREAFAVECLRPSSTPAMLEQFETNLPRYESIGESRVSEGRYREVVRYREHVLPVFNALGISPPGSALPHRR